MIAFSTPMRALPLWLGLGTWSMIAAEEVDYLRDVKPILQEHCYSCHGEDKQRSGLRLDIRAAALKGGEYHAPNIKPGSAADSSLLAFVRGDDPDMLMPPKGGKLSDAEISILERWIQGGATWPQEAGEATVVDKRDHWSFKPIASHPGGSIDHFIQAKLQTEGLTPSPPAERRTLIRRLYLILHGLLPSMAEVERFANDPDPLAYEKLVDRLLDSPRYGERWARHWLDVIAFGETHGFEVNTPRPNAWPYRDYVIAAFNQDTPYPRFIMEQLAGDTLGKDAATGFLVASAALLPGQIGKDDESKAKARQDELSDMVSLTGAAFLGLTLHCARCHDHKFDPVSQADYYGIQAVFAGVRHGERPLLNADMRQQMKEQEALPPRLWQATAKLIPYEPIATATPTAEPQRPAVHAHRNVDRFPPTRASSLRFTVTATNDHNKHEPCLDELEIYTVDGRNVALDTAGASVKASGSLNSGKHQLAHLNDGRYGNSQSWISTEKGRGWVEVQFPVPVEITAVVWGRDRLDDFSDRLAVGYHIEAKGADGQWQRLSSHEDRHAYQNKSTPLQMRQPTDPQQLARWYEVRGEIQEIESRLTQSVKAPMVYAGRFEKPAQTYRLHRGEATQPREEIQPTAVHGLGADLVMAPGAPEQERRVALAQWLSDPANPLPARVLVNRLWQHHFGEGLVSTPNDLGRNGSAPSHPELLDWLAGEFIRSGWSMKHVQRLIVHSATWRQSSAPRAEGLARDADARLLWRFPPRRMEAEVLRDTLLQTAGTLDLRMGGPGYSVFAPNSNYVRVYDPRESYGPEEWRRMIYMTKVRMAQDASFGAFDCPDAGQSQPKRARSTTALQALNLFNSSFVLQQADLFALQLARDAGPDMERQTERAFRQAMQRDPRPDELSACRALVTEHGLPALCRVLFNTNEFLFIP